ncbi:MAG: MBL fold metallo-hydrolase [Chitinophagaceae bacterium]|nr:MBL fold metallo-hydrolase [Chitinophagaceae bacterium]
MFIKQLYTNCLSEAAYFIESNGEAAVIDPLRDIDAYVQLAAERGAKIKYIFETHFHADFVSGHLELQKATGASIVYGPGAETGFPIYQAADGEAFSLGNISLHAMHTPGHTIESTCYLLKDEQGRPHALFTGDALFAGDVGRPDLSSGDLTKEELAALMYNSLKEKILKLPDEVLVYPAHGPGSSCGKNLASETVSTIGQEKATNYALQPQNMEDFIRAVTDGLDTPPPYFPINARINKEGYEPLDLIFKNALTALSLEEFKRLAKEEDAIVLDTRAPEKFIDAYIPRAVNIGLDGRFAEWAAIFLPFDKPIVMITEKGREKETATRLSRVGFSKIRGYLNGGFQTWLDNKEPIDMIIEVEADELAMDIPFDDQLAVIDVRRKTEYGDGHVKRALNIPLDDFADPGTFADFEDHHNLYLYCGGGYRSIIAASLLKRQGIHNLRSIAGGWDKIVAEKNIETAKETSLLN